MLLEFVLIPYNTKCEDYAKTLINILNKCKNVSITIDTKYELSVTNRQNKHKTSDKNFILIDEICIINNEIIVKYSDKGSRAKRYDKDDFIELLESFNTTSEKEVDSDEECKDERDNKNDDTYNDNENNSGCLIM
uniref:Uncharacterized protein n=1 Tax=viral metagenome TaxID=1070528 RepID=A0A6C0ISA4_9ZZZZ